MEHPYDCGWPAQRDLVLAEIRRCDERTREVERSLHGRIDDCQKEISAHNVDLAVLQVRVAMIGAAAGAVVTLGKVLLDYLTR